MKPHLLLDLGNTRLKWALALPPAAEHPQWRLGEVAALAHSGPDFLPALEQALRGLPELHSVHLVAVAAEAMVDAIQHCVAASVRVRRPGLLRARTAAEAPTARGAVLRCAYPRPEHLGTDRWLSLRGALAIAAPPLLVVGAGTALTIDAIDRDCRHLGGLILGGITTMHESLLARAPHLRMPGAMPVREAFWADDTAPAVAMAPWQAAAGLIERARRRLEREAGEAPLVVLAGGDAAGIAPLLECPVRVEAWLVLQGLLQAAVND
ncbi:MAG: type III pantothenate kinase [Lysobacterales bacterium]|jgi:type III pantothenate kinase